MITERAAVRTEGIVDPVRRKWTPRPVRIGRRVLLVRIRAQFAEVIRMDGERQDQQEKDNPHGNFPTNRTTSASAYSDTVINASNRQASQAK